MKSVAAVYDRRTSSAGKSATVADRRYNKAARARTDQSFLVPKADIVANGYDLSLNRYKEVVHEVVNHDSPKRILARLAKLEDEIAKGGKELEGLLG